MLNYYVSPVQVLIEYLSQDASLMTLIDSQIATRHKFSTDQSPAADDWNIANPGLTIRGDGGTSQKYVREQVSNLECIVWSENFAKGYQVHGEIVRIVRDSQRTTVNGNLLLSLSLETQPTQLIDPDTSYPQIMFFLMCVVGENKQE